MGGGGGNSLIKVGMDVWQMKNLGRAKFLQIMPRQKSAQKPNDWASFHELPKLEFFSKYVTYVCKYVLHIFCQKLPKA